jgi:hypothetical protein
MTGFEFNEDLKDCCALLGADTAITILFKKGVPLMPEPFYETHIIFPEETNEKNIVTCVKSIQMYLNQLANNRIECSDIVMESKKGVIKVIYTIFCSVKKFTTKQLKYID